MRVCARDPSTGEEVWLDTERIVGFEKREYEGHLTLHALLGFDLVLAVAPHWQRSVEARRWLAAEARRIRRPRRR
jgi:hypothetical protein